jgi:hypothetical protein
VQGVGPNGERLVQDAVAADLLELDIAQQQVPAQVGCTTGLIDPSSHHVPHHEPGYQRDDHDDVPQNGRTGDR